MSNALTARDMWQLSSYAVPRVVRHRGCKGRPLRHPAESAPVRNTEVSANKRSLLRPARTKQGAHAVAVTTRESTLTVALI